MNRLKNLPTLKINPLEKISFEYKGKTYFGADGDTIATALFANKVRIFSRSLKYRRPRGLYSLDGECSNTFMNVDKIPNVRSENTFLKNKMKVKAQNIKGSVENDYMGFMDKLDFLMPAGFYYRMMHKPAFIWPFAMKMIRKAAGTGKIEPDFRLKGKYDEIYPGTDICVIGGGPAGMTAALTAAGKGLRVILLESKPYLGGFFDYRISAYDANKTLFQRAGQLVRQVENHPGIRVFKHTSMIGAYQNNLITAFQVGKETDVFDERYVEIRAQSVIVSTGCIERPLIFENNEKPGVMQVSCAHRLAHTYGILPGKQAVFSVGHDLGLEAAIDLHDLGLKIQCIADLREDGHDKTLVKKINDRGILFLKGWIAANAKGRKHINKVVLTSLDGMTNRSLDCDLLVASAGMTPVTGPLTIARAKLEYDDYTSFFLPKELPDGMHAAGRMLGFTDPLSIEASGAIAGLKAANDCNISCEDDISEARNAMTRLPGPAKGNKIVTAPVRGKKSFICFDEDTTIKNIRQAIDMGFDVPELIKRFTSAGTGPGQGGIPGHNLPLFVAEYRASSGLQVKPTTVRPPLVPTLIATYAGSKHWMCKRTPLHDSQKKAGGIFRHSGAWKRAYYFSRDLDCKDEILNIRNNVGMLDASTLGKFRIFGPDAVKALQRVFISDMSKIKEGRLKYSAMCNDDGCVIDDGVIVKRAENDFYFTTSSARAGYTIEWISYHTFYDHWDFHIVNLTDSMGVINLCGPNARKVLEKVTDHDVSQQNFKFMEYHEFKINGLIPVKAMRLGFIGELSYELHAPASYMEALWEILEQAGEKFNIKNFGIEAQNVLRMEKCHIILGDESEQRMTLIDLGLGFLWARNLCNAKKIGAVALRQTENQAGKLKLVGIKMDDPHRPVKDGSLIVDERILGYVCTLRKSLSLNESIGMALVESQYSKIGTRLEIFEEGGGTKRHHASVVPMPFYDPAGTRIKM